MLTRSDPEGDAFPAVGPKCSRSTDYRTVYCERLCAKLPKCQV